MRKRDHNSQPSSPVTYAVVSLIALLIGISLLLLFIFKATDLVRIGIEEKVFYVLLFPMGLSAAAFLFGAMNSYAVYKHKKLGGALELGGPVVIFVIVILGGLQIIPKTSPFNITAFVHKVGNKAERINSGRLILTYGDNSISGDIDDNGRVVFTSIPRKYMNQNVLFSLDADGYEIATLNEEFVLDDKSIFVAVRRDSSLSEIHGIVTDESGDQFLQDVLIIVDGETARTNEYGIFELKVPADQQKEQYDLILKKEGYKTERLFYSPKSGKVEIRLKQSHSN